MTEEMHENPMIRDTDLDSILSKPPSICRDGITNELWCKLSKDTRKRIYSKIMMKSMAEGAMPSGINESVWVVLSDDEKIDVLINTHMVPAKQRSPLWSFIFDIESINVDYDTSFSAISIVSALLLTIPFSAFSFYNDDFFEAIRGAIIYCEENQPHSVMAHKSLKDIVSGAQSYISAVFFSSLMGIIVSTIYFIFKPTDISALSRRSKLKIKGLALIGSTIIFINLFSVMVLGIQSIVHISTMYTYCGNITNVPLVLGVFFSFVVAGTAFYLIT
jgi:hypothetical protein